MTFRNDKQRGEVCKAITERIPGGPWWVLRQDVEQPPSVLRPSDAALDALEMGHGTRASAGGVAKHGLEPWAECLLRCAFDFWGNCGNATVADVLMLLDPGNQAMIGSLIQAHASGNPTKIDAWLMATREATAERYGRALSRAAREGRPPNNGDLH